MNEIEKKEANMMLCLKVLQALCEDLTELTGVEYEPSVLKKDDSGMRRIWSDDNER